MRRRLIGVFVAVSTMVALAFVLPLALLVHRTAEDRALDAARADASAIVPVLVSGGSALQIESAMDATESGRSDRMTVRTPDGTTVGADVSRSDRLDNAATLGLSDTGDTDGGTEVVRAVASGPGELWSIRVFVPTAQLRQGRTVAWASLLGVALGLVAISVAIADQLARSIVRPTQRLAKAAALLGAGELDTRVRADGPPELVELSHAFNDLGAQVSSMLVRERELVAELSHRLRTPLTKLRLRLEQVPDSALAGDLARDLDDVTLTVNQLISEARTSLGEHQIGRCDVAEVLIDRVSFWSVLAEDQERPLSFDPPGTAVHAPLREADLAAALDVLFENVFAHTPETTRIGVGLSLAENHTQIWVEDDGPGIVAASTVRGESSTGSTGLGLDIARRTTERAGGSFLVVEAASGGTRIEMRLPKVLAKPA